MNDRVNVEVGTEASELVQDALGAWGVVPEGIPVPIQWDRIEEISLSLLKSAQEQAKTDLVNLMRLKQFTREYKTERRGIILQGFEAKVAEYVGDVITEYEDAIIALDAVVRQYSIEESIPQESEVNRVIYRRDTLLPQIKHMTITQVREMWEGAIEAKDRITVRVLLDAHYQLAPPLFKGDLPRRFRDLAVASMELLMSEAHKQARLDLVTTKAKLQTMMTERAKALNTIQSLRVRRDGTMYDQRVQDQWMHVKGYAG